MPQLSYRLPDRYIDAILRLEVSCLPFQATTRGRWLEATGLRRHDTINIIGAAGLRVPVEVIGNVRISKPADLTEDDFRRFGIRWIDREDEGDGDVMDRYGVPGVTGVDGLSPYHAFTQLWNVIADQEGGHRFPKSPVRARDPSRHGILLVPIFIKRKGA